MSYDTRYEDAEHAVWLEKAPDRLVEHLRAKFEGTPCVAGNSGPFGGECELCGDDLDLALMHGGDVESMFLYEAWIKMQSESEGGSHDRF